MQEENTCYELTHRQKEVLALLRKGLTNQEICKALNISPNTVNFLPKKDYGHQSPLYTH